MMKLATLIATNNRWDLLTGVSLPSVRRQTRRPDWVVIVNDGTPFNADQEHYLCDLFPDVSVIITGNRRTRGAAGAWNTGLQEINRLAPDAYVAILDDDDAWEPDHLKINADVAERDAADIVVSGLRLILNGRNHERPHVGRLSDRTFLIENPGWQGSNTFVSLKSLIQVGGFRDGLKSTNDRDLAIRLLRIEGVRVSYTGLWTSSWHIRTGLDALSSVGSAAKRSGLRWFWQLYAPDMTAEEASRFFEVALIRFGIVKDEILLPGADVPTQRTAKGDLHVD